MTRFPALILSLSLVLFMSVGCASTSEISSLRTEVSSLRAEAEQARVAAETAASEATLAREEAQRAAEQAVAAQTQATLATWLDLLLPERIRVDWPMTEAATERATRASLQAAGRDLVLGTEGPDGLVTPLLVGHALAWLEELVGGEKR